MDRLFGRFWSGGRWGLWDGDVSFGGEAVIFLDGFLWIRFGEVTGCTAISVDCTRIRMSIRKYLLVCIAVAVVVG